MLIPEIMLQKKENIKTPRKVAVLGSTGSIGTSALEVIGKHRDTFEVFALVAGQNVELLAEQIQTFRPRYAALADKEAFPVLNERLNSSGTACETEVLCGKESICELVGHADIDIVLAGIVGMAGLASTLAAAKAGKQIALANKESLVAGGALLSVAAKQSGSKIIPVDSEHSALFQALQGECLSEVRNLILTASGGPFLNTPVSDFPAITPEQAIKHPRWNMGAKVSIDSATLMNKALELIEAHWLFAIEPERIEVLIHPQSIVHSLVEFVDGSQIAQLSNPDMKGPIAYALQYPFGRLPGVVTKLKLQEIKSLEFYDLDNEKFPAVELARQCLACQAALRKNGAIASEGGKYSAQTLVFNLANEVAVAAFLQEQLSFDRIIPFIKEALVDFAGLCFSSAEELFQLEEEIRVKLMR